ncbi:hypothetical protein ACFWP3_05745 [Streptomyces sp. NPDC058525]|uniref:hypothetical protein n=1 Tax=unclassified Streptomyces TaxID=2593676 RepID=UPI00365559A5
MSQAPPEGGATAARPRFRFDAEGEGEALVNGLIGGALGIGLGLGAASEGGDDQTRPGDGDRKRLTTGPGV